MNDKQTEIKELVNGASADTQKLIKLVFELERSKLFMSQPIGIVDQILSTIKDVVR